MILMLFKEDCMEATQASKFGLCDDDDSKPAYIDLTDKDSWQAEIENQEEVQVYFYSLDACADIKDANNNIVSLCDGALKTPNKLFFVELKNRKSKGWRSDAIKQLKNTLDIFFAVGPANLPVKNIKCYICNRRKPNPPLTNLAPIQQFKQETGVTLFVQKLIKI